jgi:TRAP transporter TAXI family solute receptor
LGIAGCSYKDSRLSFTESANALRDGTIDVGILVGGTRHQFHPGSGHHPRHPDPRVFARADPEKILAANETYSAVDLAGGVYRGIDQPVPTIGVWNVMICQASLDTDLVYKLVKALFENNDYLQKIHPSAAYTTPENAVKYSPIPLHPGTIKYLKEKGIACRIS